MRRLFGWSIAAACILASASARAEEDVTTLEAQLREEHAALTTEDCALACRALASIRRAGERICALEPGPRCEQARSKVEDARRRVSEACPECALAATPPREDERRAAQPVPATPAPTPADASTHAHETGASESAPRRGGCASCNTPGSAPSGDASALVLAAWAASRLRKKRR